MNKYEYGNYLARLRNEHGYKQSYIAKLLDLSDKTISKWENGISKPNIEQTRMLSKIYNVPFEELAGNQEEEETSTINKIVLTGGPCAGKTTALSLINNYFSNRGYSVIVVPETATELISNGISPWTCKSNYDYQTFQIKLQKMKEEIFESAAKKLKGNKVLIVCDRGVLDNKAYMEAYEFIKILKDNNTSEVKERDSYDAVFHLVSAAKGKEDVYTLSNNTARIESIEEAKILDDKIIASWTGHPHFRVIDNSSEFEEKLERLLKEITSFLGEPEPFEIERKYLISYPDIKKLESMPNCTKVDITQTYLKSDDETERRVRSRGIDGDYLYYLTEKRKISNLKRIETERRLTLDEYLKLLMQADNRLHQIQKTRYCLTENNQYFEIDVYPEWNNQAIMEIELRSEDQEVILPSFIKIISEVTEKEEYKNYNMASKMPKELVLKRK